MMTLVFVMLVIAIFVGLLGLESAPAESSRLSRSAGSGLWTWLTTGNWSAKLGAGLIILGVGALLRWLLINVELPDGLKLGSGLALSTLLALAGLALRSQPERRGLRLALAGAAGGVAYLTAYSAYALFGYIASSTAFALLALVAAMAGMIAVRERAQSMAVLAMLGGFIAPYFALEQPEPLELNGYYLLLSLLVLLMVALRGWRALIHLSFLFTLAATLFFGWSQNYYAPQHYAVMLPMLLALTGVHLAMPLLEALHGRQYAAWLRRVDEGYAWALPLAALALAFKLAPDDGACSSAIALLAGVWLLGAALAHVTRQAVARYLWTAGAMLLLAAAVALPDLPWPLLGALIACALYASAPRLGWQTVYQGWIGLAALTLASAHIAGDAFNLAPPHAAWREYGENFALAGALLGAAWAGRRRGSGLVDVMGWAGGLWGALTLIRLLIHLHLDNWPSILFAAGLIASGALFALRRQVTYLLAPSGLAVWLTVSGQAAAAETALPWTALAIPFVLLAMTLLVQTALHHSDEENRDTVAGIALLLLPLALWPWAQNSAQLLEWQGGLAFGLSVLMVGVLCSAAIARAQLAPDGYWHRDLAPVMFWLVAALLAVRLAVQIERGLWSMVFEALAFAYLALRLHWVVQDDPRGVTARRGLLTGVLLAALFLQAHALRQWGPPHEPLTIMDLRHLNAPMLLSLLWAALGALLTIGGHKLRERLMWSAGAALLVLAAAKIVLWDLGGSLDALGSLQNIVAIIATGCVFLAVSWWAPFPPARPAPPPPQRAAHQAASRPAAERDAVPMADHPSPSRKPPPKPTGGNFSFWLVLGLALLLAWAGYQSFNKSRHRLTRVQEIELKAAYGSVEAGKAALALEEERRAAWKARQKPPASADNRPPAPPVSQPAAKPAPPDQLKDFTGKVKLPCAFADPQFPDDMVVYAAGGYKGRELDFQIDQSGHVATQIDVTVNSPARPVALMLGAYEPTIWNIGWTENTRILAVLVSGYHKQAAAGLPDSVPVINSSYDNQGACGYFYIGSVYDSALNPIASQLFGKPVERTFPSDRSGAVAIGEPLTPGTRLFTSSATPPSSFRAPNTPLAGQAGLDDALAKGILRPATDADRDAWAASSSAGQGILTMSKRAGFRSYVVLKPFTYPAGLSGPPTIFFIPAGVPAPQGKPGPATVLNFNTLDCQGAMCLMGR
ncbi:MAG: DUF2339 domain-containing protein [Azonexus sp.]|jgi:hypothetical protein|nr:DUF2339 domain-containing protein [Azonexus sp.]